MHQCITTISEQRTLSDCHFQRGRMFFRVSSLKPRQEGRPSPSPSRCHIVTSSHRHAVTAPRRHAITPSHHHTVTPSRRHIVTPSHRHTTTLSDGSRAADINTKQNSGSFNYCDCNKLLLSTCRSMRTRSMRTRSMRTRSMKNRSMRTSSRAAGPRGLGLHGPVTGLVARRYVPARL